MKELKEPVIENNCFEANGRKYVLSASLSIERYKEYERLQHHVVFGADAASLVKTLKDIFDLLNKSKPADAAVVINNVLDGVSYQADEKRRHPIMYLCGLFINKENEDINTYNQANSEAKIQDWENAGIPMSFFFRISNSLTNIHAEGLSKDLEVISEAGAVKNGQKPTKKS